MGNPETKATLGYDIVQWQANEEIKRIKHGKLKDAFMHSINYEVNKIKNRKKSQLGYINIVLRREMIYLLNKNTLWF